MSVTARALWLVGSIAVTALLVLGWQLIANYSGIPPVFLPGPDREPGQGRPQRFGRAPRDRAVKRRVVERNRNLRWRGE